MNEEFQRIKNEYQLFHPYDFVFGKERFPDVFGFMDREMRFDADVVWDIRLSENSRCVIVMTNLAFAPEGRKRKKGL